MANSAKPDQTAPKEQSDQVPHCLLGDLCPSISGAFGNTAPGEPSRFSEFDSRV